MAKKNDPVGPDGDLSPDAYVALLTHYRPIEAQSKRWIAADPAPTTRILRVQIYHDFLETACRIWPKWPPPPLYSSLEYQLLGFEAVAIATLFWAGWADQKLFPGLRALTLLCEDLAAALKGAQEVPPREPLWRPDA